MLNAEEFRDMALAFPGTGQKPHFDRVGFHIIGKRMFATYLPADNSANIFLTPEEQAIFCKMAPKHIFPVANKWGEKGATTFILDSVDRDFVSEALLSAYEGSKH